MLTGISYQKDFRKRNDEWSDSVWSAIKEEDTQVRFKMLQKWRDWPSAYEMHPKHQAEHFLPLIVCAGAGGMGRANYYKDEFLGLDVISYYWNQ